MFSKMILVVLVALLALAAVDSSSKHDERQTPFPDQFTQFTNKFQEAFVNPTGNIPAGLPQFPVGQIPTNFPSPALPFARRQIDGISSTMPMDSRHGYTY